MRRTILAAAVAASLAAGGAEAGAAGGGPGTDVGRIGIEPAGGGDRWVTLPIQGETVLARLDRNGRGVLWHRPLRGFHAITGVSLDGTPTGLSADGGTLVLQRGSSSRPRRSLFTVVDARRMRVTGAIRLRGNFTLDAVSPDGRLVYFIEYTSRTDVTRYNVRVYDRRRGRLRPEPIVDRYEPDEVMRGLALTRATSADGRWEYTLYSGTGKHPEPFVHALDTVRAQARCIDLHGVEAVTDPGTMRLRLDAGGRELAVLRTNEPVAVVDTRSFEVHAPGHADGAAAPAGPRPRRQGLDGGSPWPAAAVAGIVALLAAGALRVRGRRPRRPGASQTP